jgi:tetratricopeptide (TPR) repeat protein
MADNRLVITESGFLTEFLSQHTQRTDRPFCFILGAGASRSSGIPTGGELAHVWLRELHEAENFDRLSLDEWATPARLGIEGFVKSHAANFYPQLYQRRYGDHEQAGYAFLESQMEGKEPSYGYSVLAYLLSETTHRVVVTTNFDNLVADALSIHSSRFPLVIGHDSLAQYAAVELRRPLVAKIHGALGFSPKNQPDDISQLPEGWQKALARILDRYTPIVLGYGGNDGSLMGFLQALPSHVPDRIYWCILASGAGGVDSLAHVSTTVRDYVQSRRGRFVPITGFDELMAKLLTKLREKGSVPDLYQRLQDRHRQRERNYDDQQRRLFEAAVSPEPREKRKASEPAPGEADRTLAEAVSEIAESRKDKPWWVWANEADDAAAPEEKERIFLRALEVLPDSADLYRNYAAFLEITEPDKAQQYYERAVELNPNGALTLVSYADFLKNLKGAQEKAQALYERAVSVEPNYAFALAHYALFLERTGDLDKAEELYKHALEVRPDYEFALDMYADFLKTARGNQSKAEEMQQRLQEVKRNSAQP